jgi:carbon storage regulator CsrA
MLVLSRHAQQSIVLPDLGITVRVLYIKGNLVRIGIDAPRAVNVVREELLDRALVPAGAGAEEADVQPHAA